MTQTAAKTSPQGQHIAIIGGGASGVLMAAHLLRESPPDTRITIIEGRHMLGCGIAYSTHDPDHLLNTRVQNMSAFPDTPQHFHDWLKTRPEGQGINLSSFVSRTTYGAYMADLLAPWQSSPVLNCLRDTCIGLQENADGVVLTLSDGSTLNADRAILATGHVEAPPDPSGVLSGPWQKLDAVDKQATVAIIGSGLSMIDQVLSLLKSGHSGKIIAVSRRGQLPRPHTQSKPMPIPAEEVPLGAPVSILLHWARAQARKATFQGGSWQDGMDAIRPHVRSIWRAWPKEERQRFLRHAATWWDVHRHRIPPASEMRIREAIAKKQLLIKQASFLGAEALPSGLRLLKLRPRGSRLAETVEVARVIDCRGIMRDPEANASPLIAGLLQSGQARLDGLRIGLDVTADCALIDRDNHSSQRIMAIGPASRSAFWEITAIPDIREQTAKLAHRLNH